MSSRFWAQTYFWLNLFWKCNTKYIIIMLGGYMREGVSLATFVCRQGSKSEHIYNWICFKKCYAKYTFNSSISLFSFSFCVFLNTLVDSVGWVYAGGRFICDVCLSRFWVRTYLWLNLFVCRLCVVQTYLWLNLFYKFDTKYIFNFSISSFSFSFCVFLNSLRDWWYL